jgi:hypothetical protein
LKSHWIEHQGRRVFYADYSGFGDNLELLQEEMEPVIQLLSELPAKSVDVVANFEGTDSSIPTINLLKRLLPRANPAVRKRAILGVTGSKRFLQTTLLTVTGNTTIHLFDNLELALEWLSKP